ncbi:MAG: hypothetical protein IJU81_01775 [Bacteroidales bacterium]|nr:hypothetical protein [Bacteroidales bacterium]
MTVNNARDTERQAAIEELEALAHATKFGADMGDDVGEGRRTLSERIRGLVNNGKPVTTKTLLSWLPCILLIGVLCIGLVWQRYNIEKLSKEKEAVTERINIIKEKQLEMQKAYNQSVMISHIIEEMDSCGVKMHVEPPYKIRMKSNE